MNQLIKDMHRKKKENERALDEQGESKNASHTAHGDKIIIKNNE